MSKDIKNIADVKDADIQTAEIKPSETKPVENKWKTKTCRVVNYIAKYGILGFDFDGTPCQIAVDKNLKIGSTVEIKYQGEIGKNIKFKI